MSSADAEPKTNESAARLVRGVFTLLMLIVAAAAGGSYFALTLH